MRINNLKSVYIIGILLFLSISIGCQPTHSAQKSSVEDQKILKRADEFLQLIREDQWQKAARYVYLDKITKERLEISESDNETQAQEKVIKFLKEMYEVQKPGSVRLVKISVKDPKVSRISYRHGDLDAFTMRKVDGEWYYTLDYALQ